MSITRVVAITGCDSGLGWSIAARSAREGLITVAGMYQGTETEAAKELKKLCAHPCTLDVNNPESVIGFRDFVKDIIKSNPGYRLHAVVNNAGIMTVGDYEWLTSTMIENTFNVNVIGAMRVASAFIPDLRRNALETTENTLKPRLINVASHCGLQPLPGFGVYSASKAALLTWTQALRMEQCVHGLSAVAFIPGGFVGSSNILSYQESQMKTMMDNLDEEQKQHYQKRIQKLKDYLASVSKNFSFDSMKDEYIIETFMKTLLDQDPKPLYKVECLRYKCYYNLMKLPLPEYVNHWLIRKFISFPDNE